MDNNENIGNTLDKILSEQIKQTNLLKSIESTNESIKISLAIIIIFYIVFPVFVFGLVRFTDVRVLDIIFNTRFPF